MRQLRQGLQIVAKSVLMGDPGHGHQAGVLVDVPGESLGARNASLAGHDAHLQATRLGELLIQDKGRFVVKIIDDDVVPPTQVEGSGDNVLPVAGG